MEAERTLALGDLTFTATGEFGPTAEEQNSAQAEVMAICERAKKVDALARERAKAIRDAGGPRELYRAALDSGREALRIANEAADAFSRWAHGPIMG